MYCVASRLESPLRHRIRGPYTMVKRRVTEEFLYHIYRESQRTEPPRSPAMSRFYSRRGYVDSFSGAA